MRERNGLDRREFLKTGAAAGIGATLLPGLARAAADPPSAFDVPSAESLEGHGQRAGRVIDSPANESALTEAMRELCDDTERRACSMACIGIERRVSMDVHVDRLEKLLGEVASAADGRGNG